MVNDITEANDLINVLFQEVSQARQELINLKVQLLHLQRELQALKESKPE